MKLFLLVAYAHGALASAPLRGGNLLQKSAAVQEPLGTEENSGLTYETIGFYVCLVLLLIVLCLYGAVGKKPAPPPKEQVAQQLVTKEQIDERKQKLTEEFKALKELESELKQGMSEEEEPLLAPGEPMDYDKMMKTFAQQVQDKINEKMQNEGAVRKILEDRMNSFGGKAKTFMMGELNTTAGDLMKAVDAEEALLLLEWNQAVEANFPPASVMLAGLLSPVLLTIELLNHILQGLLLYLPIFCLCVASVIIDAGIPCPGIPGMFIWLYVHLFLTFVLFVAHFIQMIRIIKGKSALNAKAAQVQEKLKEIEGHQEHGISDMREMFVGNAVLIQQALLIEDYVRKSIFHNIIGFFTLLWIFATIWTFVIVVGWTFVPGVAAFHMSARETAGDAFCGIWMTVFTARLCSLFGLIFLLVNIIEVVRWIIDCCIHSASFEKNLLRQMKHIDDSAGGVPVCQILAKALVLRGSSDTVYAELNVCANESIYLRRQYQKTEAELKLIDSRLEHFEGRYNDLQQRANAQGGDTSFGGIIKSLENPNSNSEWKERGLIAVNAAVAKTLPSTEAEPEPKELNRFVERIQEVVDTIMNSEEFKAAQDAAREAAEEAAELAKEAAARAQELAVEAAQAAQEAGEQAIAKAKEIAESEEVQQAIAQGKEMAEKGIEKGKELAAEGVEKGKELAEKGIEKAKEIAESEEVQQAIAQGKEAVEKGVEKGKEVAEKAVEKGKEVAKDVQEKGEKVAKEVQEKGTEAVEEAKKKAEEAAKK